MTETSRILRIVKVDNKLIPLPVKSIQSGFRANPEIAVEILFYRMNVVVAQTVGDVWFMIIRGDDVTIILVKTVQCTKPHDSFTILHNWKHGAVRKTLF